MDQKVFKNKVLPLFLLTLFICLIGIGIGFFIPTYLYFPIIICEFIILLITVWARGKKFQLPSLIIFVLLSGITMTPIIYFTAIESGVYIIFEVLLITIISFSSLVAYVYFTKKSFLRLNNIMYPIFIGIIIASLINIFFYNSLFSLIIDIITLIVFLLFILYDTSKILKVYNNNEIVEAVIAYYLDFINIFIVILRMLRGKRRK